MNGHLHIVFAPAFSWAVIEAAAALAILMIVHALRVQAKGTGWRALACALFILALANPSLVSEQREPLKDTALVAVDDSASMKIGDRAQQTTAALDAITKKLAGFSDLDVETIHVKGNEETDLFHTIEQKLASIPRERLAGVIALTDGEVHDQPEGPVNAPFHVLLAGHKNEMDRRILVKEAPAYGLVGKSVTVTLRIEDTSKNGSDNANVTFRRDNGDSQTVAMPVGKDVPFTVPVDHAGQNLFAFSVENLPDELTTINNTTSVNISGIRDRLRVLLISGQPHIGGRTWRNFLKADPAVDLVHFTILRSPAKMDMVPNTELSLIAFPVHELFETKLQSFDLVIFDRFRQQSLVDNLYLENIAKYVENGGALLISSSTDEKIPALTLSPLMRVLPTEPTGRILTGRFVPALTEAGEHHPVTSTLYQSMPQKDWGPWFRQTDTKLKHGEVLMTGLNNSPLLVLDHVGQGRVAQFSSDQFWLWSRGYENGGPQAEMLRRVAHWLVQEPDLDEDALRAHGELTDSGWQLVITKQSLHDKTADITVADPHDAASHVTLNTGPQAGVLTATVPVPEAGLYHLSDKDKSILVMAGPADAPEFGEMISTDQKLISTVKSSGGGIFRLEDRMPDIKRTTANGTQSGWNWIGLKQNGQYRVTGSKAFPLLPAWALIIALLATIMLGWRREGR